MRVKKNYLRYSLCKKNVTQLDIIKIVIKKEIQIKFSQLNIIRRFELFFF